MKIIKSHTISTFVSQLLLAAIVLTLFLGQGVHLHFSIHDLFHHHDSPIVLHSHESSDEKQDSNEKDSHQHSVATLEFNANISNSGQFAISEINKGQSGAVLVDVGKLNFSLTEQFAIPPPLSAASILSTSSLSLRAPPEA